MPYKTCFVIMGIGDQKVGELTLITGQELRRRFDDLIKEALLKADPRLEIVRADDITAPGTITGDIIQRIMHSDLVIADVSYPNPNVFYELGLRHACRNGTIIIKDKNTTGVPFDIAHLRHIPYENTSTGLKELSSRFREYLDFSNKNPDRPDSQFQEVARLTKYKFPKYAESDSDDPETQAMIEVMQTPEVLELLMRKASGEDISQSDFFSIILKNPNIAGLMTKAMVKSGRINFDTK